MPDMINARRRALRALLSTLAGGGLTAAGLGGPLAGNALAAGETATTPTSTSTAAETTPATNPEAPATSTGQTTTPASTTTTPAPTTPPTTGSTTVPAPAPPAEAPVVVLQRRQKATPGGKTTKAVTPTTAPTTAAKAKSKTASGPNNVAASPQSVAQAGALAAILASSDASAQALGFYRIPVFLLPIYKAAAVQYGVPWQILAAINEIETDYGTDLSVSSAGAVGWMQFMPETWLQYGVDALNAGYADPYNPVDAIFAAARYLRAAGAATNLRGAILAYNHSEEYAESVLLRAKLISTYPKAVIATLTGLIDGRLPVTGKHVAWTDITTRSVSPSSATAGAAALPAGSAQSANGAPPASGTSSAATPATGAAAPLSPTAAAAAAGSKAASAKAQPLQLVDLKSSPNASVVAVQDGRIMQIGDSHELGKYIVLRDVYGDLFTYAGLGSIAPTFTPSKGPSAPVKSPVVEAASAHVPTPSLPATAGSQSPLTLSVKTPSKPSTPASAGSGQASVPATSGEEAPAGMGKARLFAHPDNPDARAAAAASAASRRRNTRAGEHLPLRRGSVVASGTVLGHVGVSAGASSGQLKFAIRPSGDSSTIDPGPVLANWAQLQAALHPQGAKSTDALLGATASDVFLQGKSQLERAVLSDPGISIYQCARDDISAGLVDRRVLAVLAFLSRSGLSPTVSALRCNQPRETASGAPTAQALGDAVQISAINGVAIAGHQGPGTITDLAIRALLTLPAEFVPHEIVSLMRYPGSDNTHASSSAWNHIALSFQPPKAAAALKASALGRTAHSANTGAAAPSPVVTTTALSVEQWNQLMVRVGALPVPKVPTKPTSSAIPDPKRLKKG
jgi:membrane-bound lytic murein transglycosylase B